MTTGSLSFARWTPRRHAGQLSGGPRTSPTPMVRSVKEPSNSSYWKLQDTGKLSVRVRWSRTDEPAEVMKWIYRLAAGRTIVMVYDRFAQHGLEVEGPAKLRAQEQLLGI